MHFLPTTVLIIVVTIVPLLAGAAFVDPLVPPISPSAAVLDDPGIF